VEHHGGYFSFGPIKMEPKPATLGGPPIWIGGRAEAALKRAAHHGDGWMPYVLTPKRIADGLEFIAREATKVGRKLESFEPRSTRSSRSANPTRRPSRLPGNS
jgi:alkanesulfonate monooxygenase SsuD/methylene tetrahydromethanopterin reductase-like flavin-dependent oxidoreductase (luciferase family)